MIKSWSKTISISDESKWINDETIDTSFYFEMYNEDSIFLTNSELLKRRIDAWRKDPISYKIDLKKVNLEKGGLIDLITQETLYVKKGNTETGDFNIPGQECSEVGAINYLDRHNINIIIEKNSMSGNIIGVEKIYKSKFLESMHEKRYKIYDNDLESIWYV
jgi:hypothetical protein